jgi:hypothetical protein
VSRPETLQRGATVPVLLLTSQSARLGEEGLVGVLRVALRNDGWELHVDTERGTRRSAVAELVVRLLEAVPDSALDGLERVLAPHLRASLPRQHNHLGRVVIYGVEGEVLRIREVAEAEAAEPERPRERPAIARGR